MFKKLSAFTKLVNMELIIKSADKTDNILFKTILPFFNSSYNFNDFSPLTLAKQFFQINNTIKEEQILHGMPAIWEDDLKILDSQNSENEIYLQSDFISFVQALKAMAASMYVNKGKGFKRMSIPPKEAYSYVGHNELDITESKVAAALLY